MILDDLRHRFLAAIRFNAVVVPVIVAAALATLGSSITTATAALVLVLVVVAFSATGDRVAGLLAAVSSGVWFDFFLTEPFHRLTVDDPDDVEVIVLLIVVGVAVTELALRGLRQQERAGRRQGYLDGVLESADAAASHSTSPDEVARHVAARIATVLEVDRCRFVPDPAPSHTGAVLRRDGSVHRGGVVLDVDHDGLPIDIEVFLPVPHGRGVQGHFRITAASRVVRPTREQLRVAVLLADQVGKVRPVAHHRRPVPTSDHPGGEAHA